jgi:WD40 repeat protein
VRGIALSPDGTHLVSSSIDDTVCLWDVATGRVIYRLPGHGLGGGRRTVGFTLDGKHFLSWGDDMYLRKWDVATGKAVLEHRLRPTGVKVPEDDEEPERDLLLAHWEGTFSPDGKTIVLQSGAQFHVLDVATGNDVRQMPNEGDYVPSLAISPDSRLLLASALGKAVRTKLADGRIRYSEATNHPISWWDLASGKLQNQVLLPDGWARAVAFAPDGKRFAAAVDKPQPAIRVFDVTTGKELRALRGFRGLAYALAFTPDGRQLISADDTSALVWDLTDGR